MDRSEPTGDLLIFAADDAARAVGRHVRRCMNAVVADTLDRPADVMRNAVRERPALLVVCLAPPPSPAIARLLSHFGRRCPGVPVVGVASTHDDAVERFARTSGVTHFVLLDSPCDVDQLDRLLTSCNLPPPAHGPPRARRGPPVDSSSS